MIQKENFRPEQILILLRNDRYGIFSKELISAFDDDELPVAKVEKENIFEIDQGYQVIALFRLTKNLEDHLAWRALLQIRHNLLGEKALSEIYKLAEENSLTFFETIIAIINGEYDVSFKDKLRNEYYAITGIVETIKSINQSDVDIQEKLSIILDLILIDGSLKS